MKRVVIVGAGALGSHVAMLLRGEASLKVIDFDRIETKNVMAQFHNKGSIGRNKAEALKGLLSLLWGTQVEAVPHKLVDNNAEKLLGGVDLVIDCLDNGAGRRVVQHWARGIIDDGGAVIPVGAIGAMQIYSTERPVFTAVRDVECLHGALAGDAQFGRAIWDEQFVIDDEATAGAATCEGGEFLPFIAVTASYLALAAQTYLKTGKKIGFQVTPGGAVRI